MVAGIIALVAGHRCETGRFPTDYQANTFQFGDALDRQGVIADDKAAPWARAGFDLKDTPEAACRDDALAS